MGFSFPRFQACLKTIPFWVDTQPSPQHLTTSSPEKVRTGQELPFCMQSVAAQDKHGTSTLPYAYCASWRLWDKQHQLYSGKGWVKSQEERPQVSRFLL